MRTKSGVMALKGNGCTCITIYVSIKKGNNGVTLKEVDESELSSNQGTKCLDE